jgi:hypothetical protein
VGKGKKEGWSEVEGREKKKERKKELKKEGRRVKGKNKKRRRADDVCVNALCFECLCSYIHTYIHRNNIHA